MDAKSHNLLESCWFDGADGSLNRYHYNALKLSNGHTFRVDFTREVTPAGININITSTQPLALGDDAAEVNTIINQLEGTPKTGFECQALGWTYLGNITTNLGVQAQINATIAAGHSFTSILYNAGYFVYGCAATKQFYDKS